MSGSRWVITPSWLSGSWRSFLYGYSVYSCHLFLISLLLLGPYHFCRLSSPSLYEMFLWYLIFLKRSLVFPILLFSSVCIDRWGRFLISPSYSLKLCIQLGIFFLFPLFFASHLFTAECKVSSDSHFAFLHFFFLGMVLIPVSCTMSRTSIHSSSGTVSDLVS